MRRRLPGFPSLLPLFLLLASMLQPATPAGATVIILDDQRSVFVDAFYSCGITSCSVSSTKSATYDGSDPSFVVGLEALDGYAFQNSSTSPTGLFGAGLTDSNSAIDITAVIAESVLTITFELTEDTPYYLFGSVDASVHPFARYPGGSATVTLSDTGGTLHSFSVNATASGPQSQPFGEGGVLAAGVYTLYAQAVQGLSVDGTLTEFEVHLALPEPATAFLVGLLLMATRLRR
jgi:hypothetical protein